ncbi:hypothetical protein ACFP2T_13430 [Plantactinospora solaniradicis]|uniref:Uncharacterized protein n=1 Tax=Plantactinospora solaniradicis TaxID=1723736 RepID=A0ABW1K6J1_9ACTN
MNGEYNPAAWSTLNDLTATRFLNMHRDGRRCWHCNPVTGYCRWRSWAVEHLLFDGGEPVPGQAAAILTRGIYPGSLTAVDLRSLADQLAVRL